MPQKNEILGIKKKKQEINTKVRKKRQHEVNSGTPDHYMACVNSVASSKSKMVYTINKRTHFALLNT